MALTKDELLDLLVLLRIQGIGNLTAKNLLSYSGSFGSILKSSTKTLQKIPGVGPKTAEAIVKEQDYSLAEKELKFMEKNDVQVFFYLDEQYPQRLKNCADSPILLFYKGNVSLNHPKIVSIIGTRYMTAYGKEMTEMFIDGLVKHQPLILSGLAYGVDFCAHKAALAASLPTIGVLGHGLDIIYPSQHREIAKAMLANGGLLTDFQSGTKPDRNNFPSRNRIIAGMADAVIVVESKITGGAMITAEIANSYNVDVFAVPGNANNEFSMGCNFLIKKNKAALLDSIDEFEFAMGWQQTEKKQSSRQKWMFIDLNTDEQILVDVLKIKNPLTLDALRIECRMSSSKVAEVLLELELKGLVKTLPGGNFALF